MDKKTKRNMRLVLIVTVILSLLLFMQEYKTSYVEKVDRNQYGEGKKQEKIDVIVGKDKWKESMEFEVHERVYGEKEIKKVFEKAMNELPDLILGKNKSFDHIEYDMDLITKLSDTPIEIRWESQQRKIMNAAGEIQKENLTGKGDMVELRAYLTYEQEEAVYIANVMVYPRTMTKKEKTMESIKEVVSSIEENSRQDTSFTLPQKVDGKKVVWEKKKEYKSVWIFMLGIVFVLLLYVKEKQMKQKETEEKNKQMKTDYPEIVNGIALLIGAGLTVKNAWKKMVDNYDEQNIEKGKRFAYEEMKNTLREMQGGISEAESYERFGNRIGIPEYVKFGTTLSQNLRKGSRGLSEILSREATHAYEERRHAVKRQGEEVSTKLLLPMSIMLIVVLIIVIFPAFLSIMV